MATSKKNSRTPQQTKQAKGTNPWASSAPRSSIGATDPTLPDSVVTPVVVRVVASILIGIGVGNMGLAIPNGAKSTVLLVCLVAAVVIMIAAPYRKDVRRVYRARFGTDKVLTSQVLPFFVPWVVMLTLPVVPAQGSALAALSMVVVTVYMYYFFPFVDGTRHTKPLPKN